MYEDKPVNYLTFDFTLGYDEKILLPFNDGIQFLQALANAKVLKNAYNEDAIIKNIKPSDLKSGIISFEEVQFILDKTNETENHVNT